jgi:hypothetical protein
MKIRTFKKLEGGVYRVAIYTQDWSELDKQLMAKFDEPEIDLGGTFTGAPSVSYALDSVLMRIMSDDPFTAAFDIDDYADAHDRADVWADTVQTRITSAVTTLRLNADGYTGEEVTEV